MPKGSYGGWTWPWGVMDKAQPGWHSHKGSAGVASRYMGFETFDLCMKFLDL